MDDSDKFDYQSVCHCSKTHCKGNGRMYGLITSQFVTAPKRMAKRYYCFVGLITSQFVTAPKLLVVENILRNSLITSQFVTAPKQTISKHYFFIV